MSDEQIPEVPPSTDPEAVVESPPIMAEPPRLTVGWVVSGLMLLLAIVSAVNGYVKGFSGDDPSFTQLQDVFEKQVSITSSLPDKLEKTAEGGVREVLDDALVHAGEHAEAARIAVVAAHEIGKKPDESALETLRTSGGELSRDIATLYSSGAVDKDFVEAFTAEESNEFAVKLAQAHAREMIGEDGGRGSFVDETLLPKSIFIMVGVLVAAAGGAFCLILFFTARSAGRLKPVGFGDIKKLDGDRLMVRFACYMVGFAFVGYGINQLLETTTTVSSIWSGAISLFAVAVFVGGVLYIPILGKADGLKGIIGGKAKDFWKNIGVGLYGYLCTVPVLIIVILAVSLLGDVLPEPSHPISEEMSTASRFDWIAIALTASILAPLIEELTFRGLLFPALVAQVKRPLWAILICGFLFAAIHPQGPLIWPALMTTGAVAAYVRYYSGSLVPSFTLHVVHNTVILATAFMVV